MLPHVASQGIQLVMSKQKHVLLPHHEALRIGGNDPSEMLLVGPRLLLEPCLAVGEAADQLPCGHSRFRTWNRSGTPWKCGFFATHFIYWAYAHGIMPFFYFTQIKVHLFRMDGSIATGAENAAQSTRTASQGSHQGRSGKPPGLGFAICSAMHQSPIELGEWLTLLLPLCPVVLQW